MSNQILKSAIAFIYKKSYSYFPGVRPSVWNDVKIPKSFIPGVVPYIPYVANKLDYSQSEGAEVNAHKKYTRPGDTVVIVGGGRGVSTVHAAWSSGRNGQVIVFEGSEDYAQIVTDTINLNQVQARVDVRTKIVGHGNKIYGSTVSTKTLLPGDLPQCDVLELDCEGAEQQILGEINMRPRVLIVEVHPKQSDADETMRLISELDYNIVDYYDNEGHELSKEEFYESLEKNRLGNGGAPVIVGLQNNFGN